LWEIIWRVLKEINAILLLGLVEHKYSSQPFLLLFQEILEKALKLLQTDKLHTQ